MGVGEVRGKVKRNGEGGCQGKGVCGGRGVVGHSMCLPHGSRDMCMIRLRLLALNEYGCGVIDILIGSVCHIGWCIVGRQVIWWEGMLVFALKEGPPYFPTHS